MSGGAKKKMPLAPPIQIKNVRIFYGATKQKVD